MLTNCNLVAYDGKVYAFKDSCGHVHYLPYENVTELIRREATAYSGENQREIVYRKGLAEVAFDGKRVQLGTPARCIFEELAMRGLNKIVEREKLQTLFSGRPNPGNAVHDGVRVLRKNLVGSPLEVYKMKSGGYALRPTSSSLALKILSK
jgi:hypothetical protein